MTPYSVLTVTVSDLKIIKFVSFSKVDQTRKFDDFLDLIQFFQIWPDSVLIEINDIINVIYKNFVIHDQLLKMHRFLTRSL